MLFGTHQLNGEEKSPGDHPYQVLAGGQFQTFHDCRFIAEKHGQSIQKQNKLTCVKFRQESRRTAREERRQENLLCL